MTSGAAPPPVADTPVVRLVTAWQTRLMSFALDRLEPAFALVRALVPLPVLGKTVVVTRYDDVREIFLSDEAFGVPYQRKQDVILGGTPFFLSMSDTPAYRQGRGAMEEVVEIDDVRTRIVPAIATRAAAAVAASGGRIEVVDLVRSVTFATLLDYFGVPATPSLPLWMTRLFEFQFIDQNDDPTLDREIDAIAPAMQAHVQQAIDERRATGVTKDDVLGRCLVKQAAGDARFGDDAIRSALIAFVAGGVPQLPMAAPQILDQLLSRPAALAIAAGAARSDDDALLGGCMLEALRFDAMAKFLQRVALVDHVIAAGTPRARRVKAGTNIALCPASAMMDGRRVAAPRTFDPSRAPRCYMHFGLGLHECFGIHINRAVLPAVLKPLLRGGNLRREKGPTGRLRKQGIFAERLLVRLDPN